MREHNNEQGIDIVSALYSELRTGNKVQPKVQFAYLKRGFSDSGGAQQSLSLSVQQIFKSANRLLRNVDAKKNILLIGVDPRRICWRHHSTFLDTIDAHVHPSLETVKEWVSNAGIDKQSGVIGFEPKISLRQLENTRYLDGEIANPVAIILAGLFRLFSWSPLYAFFLVKTFWVKFKGQTKSFRSRLKTTLSLALFVMGCEVLLRNATKVRMICLTSNSVCLDLFRCVVLERQNSNVVEILHGIPTLPVDKYLLDLGSKSSKWGGGRLCIYPLMPKPFCQPASRNDGIEWSVQASNTGIFRALNSILDEPINKMNVKSRRFRQILAEKICSTAEHVLCDDAVSITILGGHDLAQKSYSGEMCFVEMNLAMILRDQFSAQGYKTRSVYLPHPNNKILERLCFPDGERVALFSSTPLSFFFADVALSIYSSALFEAAYFGAKCFTPLTKGSSFIDDELVATLFRPNSISRTDLEKELSKVVESTDRKRISHEEKILQRIDLFFG